MNQADEPRDAIDPGTLEGLQTMDAAHDSLQLQLQTGEMTQDAYEDAWTDLIATVPPAVLKASMEKRQDAIQQDAVRAAGETPPGIAGA
jgi:hypothetical protein